MNNMNTPTFETLEPRLLLDATIWLIDSADSGTYIQYDPTDLSIAHGPFAQANLLGSEADDVFIFADESAAITGQIDGRGGTDQVVYAPYDLAAVKADLAAQGFDAAALDAAFDALPSVTDGYGSSVTINLQTGQATGTGSLVDVESVSGDVGPAIANMLIGPDAGGNWAIDATDRGTIGGVFDFTGFGDLVAGTGDDVFVFAGDATMSGQLDGGLGSNALDISARSDSVAWNLAAANAGEAAGIVSFSQIGQITGSAGADSFTVADGVLFSDGIHGGTGDDTLDMSAFTTSLRLDVSADNAGRANESMDFTGIASIFTGAGDDTFAMQASQTLAGSIDAGAGSDTLDYSDYGGDQSVSVDLQTGAATAITGGMAGIEILVGGSAWEDVLVGFDADSTWNILTDNVGQINAGQVEFEGFEFLQGGIGADTFVFSHGALLTIGLDGGDGADSIDLSAYRTANIWNVTATDAGDIEARRGVFEFASVETLIGGDREDTFIFAADAILTGSVAGGGDSDLLDLSAKSMGMTWTVDGVDAGDVDGAIAFGEIENIISGSGDDTFAFVGVGRITESLDGRAGDDSLSLQASDALETDWYILAANEGSLNAEMAFASVETLLGGSGDDTFRFADGAGVQGTVAGADGYDTLDYADFSFTRTVLVDRQSGEATATSGFSGIECVYGGGGFDTLIGLNVDSQWSITQDNGGSVNDEFDFRFFEHLTGGSGADAFVFADDAVIEGSIYGQDGDDTLDMSAYTTAVEWDVAADYAGTMRTMRATTEFDSIENLLGGAGDDAFVFADRMRVDAVAGGGGDDRMDVTSFTTGVFVNTDDSYLAIDSASVDAPRIYFDSIEDMQKNDTGVVQENYVDLSATVVAGDIFSRITPNERGYVDVTIRNEGNTYIDERIDISLSATSDVGEFLLATETDKRITLHAGQSTTVRMSVTLAGDIEPGTYDMVAEIDTGSVVDEINEVNNIATNASPLNIVWEFGRVSGRGNVKLMVPDINGQQVTFSLSGNGSGVIVGGSSFDAIYLNGTDSRTRLTITTERGADATEIHVVTAYGSLGQINASNVNLNGDMEIQGTLTSMTLNQVVAGSVTVEGALGTVRLDQWNSGTLTAESLKSITTLGDRYDDAVAGDFTATVNLTGADSRGDSLGKLTVAGAVIDSEFTLAGAAKSITAVRWDNSDLDAVSAGTISIQGDRRSGLVGDFSGDIDLTGVDTSGASIRSLTVAGAIDSEITLAGSAGTIRAGQWDDGSLNATVVQSLTTTGDRYNDDISGDFNVDVTLTGVDRRGVSLGRLMVAGTVTDSEITLAGGATSIVAVQWDDSDLQAEYACTITIRGDRSAALTGDFSGELTLTGDDERGVSLKNMTVAGRMIGATVNLAGTANTMRVGQWDSGTLTAVSVSNLSTTGNRYFDAIAGDFTTTVNLTGVDRRGVSLGRLTVAGTVADSEITLAGDVTSIVAGKWDNSDLQATYAGTITIRGDRSTALAGDFSGELTLTGVDSRGVSLNRMTVAGRVVDPTINLAGTVNTMRVGQWEGGTLTAVSATTIATTGDRSNPAVIGDFTTTLNLTGADTRGVSLKTLTIAGSASNSVLTLAGSVYTITASGWANTTLQASTAGRITLRANRSADLAGDFQGTITLTGQDTRNVSLTSMKVSGAMTSSQIRTAGGISTLTVTTLNGVDVLAGINPLSLRKPANNGDFVSTDAMIRSFTVSGVRGLEGFAMTDSNIAAAKFGTVKLVDVDFPTSGIYASSTSGDKAYSSISHTDTATRDRWTSRPTSPAGPDGFISIL